MKNKKNLFMIVGIAFLSVGTTLAYLTSTGVFNNVFNTASYETVIHEEFVSPSDWTPGDITPKTLVVRNDGDAPVYARICIEESWKAIDETILPNFNTTLNEKMAIINLDNVSDWMYSHDDVKNRDCYIYKSVINGNDVSSSFMESVTYNPNYSGGITCTYNETTHTNECKSGNSGYDGAEYTLNLIIETIQKQGINESGWGFGYSNDAENYNFENASSTLSGSSYRNFLRKAATDNGIKTQIGLKIEDDEYYITGGDTTSYEDNKAVLNEIFGSTNCTENEDICKTYTCYKDELESTIKSTGEVSLTDNGNKISISKFGIPTVEIEPQNTLYNVMRLAASEGTYAKEYTGAHQDSISGSGDKKIYYWYGDSDTNGTAILDKNNVIFANHCWQMIRTTDTGGVKMIYNGEPENNQCLNTRGTHVGYDNRTSQSLASNYWYGTDYTYDSMSDSFKLSGTVTTGTIKTGEYTCESTTADSTCSLLYYVDTLNSGTTYYVLPINSNSHYSQFGTLYFNQQYNSPSYVGYMYNTVYPYQSNTIENSEVMLHCSSLGTNYWYANSVTWGSPTSNRYNLDNPYMVSSTTDYPNLVGKYTFRSISQSYTDSTVQYISAINNTRYCYIEMNNFGNHTLADFNYSYTYGDSFKDNGNGTYTIINPTTVERKDWYTSYDNVGANKYVCKNAINDTCNELWYITSTSDISMTYINIANNFKYSKGFIWDGSKYVLNDDTSVTFFEWNNTNKTSLNNAHYTCWNTSGECTTISYIYYLSDTTPYYINISNGKSIEDAKNEMLYNNDVNTTNSTIKTGIDAWFEKNLLDYSDYLEDTVFCNDRSQRNSDTNGWNPNGGDLLTHMYFSGLADLSCPNNNDKFSTLNDKAKLKYKVGLMSYQEMNLLGNANIRKTGQHYWVGSPISSQNISAKGSYVHSSGSVISSSNVYYTRGVRPAVSLKPNTTFNSGDGSQANPYIIDMIN